MPIPLIFLPLTLLGGAVLVAGVALFWRELLDWLKRGVEKVKEIVGAALEGAKTFVVQLSDGVKNVAKYYSKNKITEEYEETVTRKAVNENEVPEELRIKIRMHMNVEIDTTEELLAKLSA